MSLKRCENVLVIVPHLASIILLIVVAAYVYLGWDNGIVFRLDPQVILGQWKILDDTINQTNSDSNSNRGECNLFSGRWIYDNVSYPLYEGRKCSFLDTEYVCEKNGRKDLRYQSWRWQPHSCDIPRFNATALLEKLRGKKLVFVGDSLNRNQWTSMLCLIEPYLPKSSWRVVERIENLSYLHIKAYNATIGFYWEPMLVESNCDEIKPNKNWPHVARIKSIEYHARHWTDTDILVFDSFAWWMSNEITLMWGSFGSPNAIYKPTEYESGSEKMLRRYEIALDTWSDWLEMHVDQTKTKLFFMSASPFRPGGSRWGTDDSCYGKIFPASRESYWSSFMNREMMQVAESVIEKLGRRGVKVEYLNITELSAYREDAHPGIDRFIKNVTSEEKRRGTARYSDCLHWCLPGVPDTWNEILSAYIMKL